MNVLHTLLTTDWIGKLALLIARIQAMTPQELFIHGMPWGLSMITIWMTILTGRKNTNSWLVGLLNQLLYAIWIVVSETWGFIPLNLTLWVLYYRNHQLWKRDTALPSAPTQSVLSDKP